MTTPIQPISKCILEYLYGLTDAKLDELRTIIEGAILFIDAQILWLRAQTQALDIMEYVVGSKWIIAKEAIDKFQALLANGFNGPVDDVCPEFYHYIVDPIIGMNAATLAALLPYKDKYGKMMSATAQFDRLLAYWEGAKAFLFAMLDVIDDAIYYYKERVGNMAP